MFFDGFVQWVYSLYHSENIFFVFLIGLFVIEMIRITSKLVLLFVHKIKERKKVHENNFNNFPTTKISLLIAAYNEENNIKKTIESAINTPYPNKEIIVIDDGSIDNTYEIAKQYEDKKQIKLICNKNGGSKARALNLGYSYATGDIIVVLDADTEFTRQDALYDMVRCFENESNDTILAASGNLEITLGDNEVKNMLTKLQTLEYIISMEIGKRITTILNAILVIPGGFGAFKSNFLNNVGKYDVDTLGEDFDLTVKLHKLGKKIVFSEKSTVKTSGPHTWKLLLKQRIRWSYAQIQVLLKHLDVLWSPKYRPVFRLAVFDMWIMDVFVNLAWITSIFVLVSIAITSQILDIDVIPTSTMQFVILLFSIYLELEASLFLYSVRVSKRKDIIKLIYLVPLMVFFYRPLLRLIILKGHVYALLGKKINW